MSKALSSWSGMRKYLEKDMLADVLKGRVRYSCTTYPHMDGSHIFEIFIDDKCIKRFSESTVYSSFMNKNKDLNNQEIWDMVWNSINPENMNEQIEFFSIDFSKALEIYRNSNIQESIFSKNPIVRMFAVLDRRIGKRTLLKLKSELCSQPKWLLPFYELRLRSEGLYL